MERCSRREASRSASAACRRCSGSASSCARRGPGAGRRQRAPEAYRSRISPMRRRLPRRMPEWQHRRLRGGASNRSGGRAMTAQLFTNVMVFDATGRSSFPGEVLIEGNRIRKVAEGGNQIARDGRQRDRRPGHDPDAGHDRGALPHHLHRRREPGRARRAAARGAHARHDAQCQAAVRPWLHQRLLRRVGQATARRGDPQRDQRRAHTRAADPRGEPRDHGRPRGSATSAGCTSIARASP